MLEAKMKRDQVLKGFMIDLQVEIDTKNSSLARQALDMCLKLVAPECCLFRAVAVLVYNLVEFLNQNPHIKNRLACLV